VEKSCIVAYYLAVTAAETLSYRKLSLPQIGGLGDYFDNLSLGLTRICCSATSKADAQTIPNPQTRWQARKPASLLINMSNLKPLVKSGNLLESQSSLSDEQSSRASSIRTSDSAESDLLAFCGAPSFETEVVVPTWGSTTSALTAGEADTPDTEYSSFPSSDQWVAKETFDPADIPLPDSPIVAPMLESPSHSEGIDIDLHLQASKVAFTHVEPPDLAEAHRPEFLESALAESEDSWSLFDVPSTSSSGPKLVRPPLASSTRSRFSSVFQSTSSLLERSDEELAEVARIAREEEDTNIASLYVEDWFLSAPMIRTQSRRNREKRAKKSGGDSTMCDPEVELLEWIEEAEEEEMKDIRRREKKKARKAKVKKVVKVFFSLLGFVSGVGASGRRV
jgi:hypothetical protein